MAAECPLTVRGFGPPDPCQTTQTTGGGERPTAASLKRGMDNTQYVDDGANVPDPSIPQCSKLG
jgi:hypothetical protein